MKKPSFIQKHSQNAILAALIASLLAFGTSVWSVYKTYQYTVEAQSRQTKLDALSRFDSSSSSIVEAAGSFIVAINAKQDMGPAREKVSAVLATQLQASDQLKKYFDARSNIEVAEYQTAVLDFSHVVQTTSDATEMRPWAESFGHVLDAKASLSKRLYSAVDLDKKS